MKDPFCAFCYTPVETLLKCGQCKKRVFCSVACQREDWKCKIGGGSHKLYCGLAGEIGSDFDIRESREEGAGLGVFACKDISKNDIIMVERPCFKVLDGTFNLPIIPDSCRNRVAALLPLDGSLQEKLDRNTMACTDEQESTRGSGESGLFLTLSRINHHCLGNADHQFMAHRGVKLLVAARSIKKGDEITISYLGSYKPKHERIKKLQGYPYKFCCKCSLCTGNPELEAKFAKTKELDNSILEVGGSGKIEMAMRKGRALIAIYDELQFSTWLYQRTYYDLFQVAVTKKKYGKDARRFVKLAHDTVLTYTKDEQHPQVLRYKDLMEAPQNHRNYLVLG